MFGLGAKKATLAFKNAPTIFVAGNPEAMKNLLALFANEPAPYPNAQIVGQFVTVPKDTKVEVTKMFVDNGFALVKILEGEHTGYQGFVPTAFIH